jgi:hypothetical protein
MLGNSLLITLYARYSPQKTSFLAAWLAHILDIIYIYIYVCIVIIKIKEISSPPLPWDSTIMGISKRYPPKPRWPRLAVIQEPTEVEHIPFMDSDVSKSRMGWLVGFSQFEKVGLTLGRWHDVLGLWTCHLPKHHSSCFSHFFG